MAPLFWPPSCAMTSPSAMIGELEVKKRGTEPRKSSLRQIFLPEEASRQERIPRTPRVTILPSATAAELRGPTNLPGSVEPWVSYFSVQISLPVAASRQRVISVLFCQEKT